MTCFGSFAIFDDLWWPLMTYDDLFWPRDQFFSKASVKSFILTYNLFTFYEVWNLTFFLLFFDLCWPCLTLRPNLMTFFEKLLPRASFWGIICILLIKIKIWPFEAFFAIFDLCWPFRTLRPTFLKSSRQELHFDVSFVYFWQR